MRTYNRRQFLTITVSTAAAAALAAACGSDDDNGDTNTATANTPAPGTTPSASSPTAAADRAPIGLRWFGQAMFLLESPGGTTVALDPFNDIGYAMPAGINANAATITHEHPDHNNGPLAGASAQILRGLTADGYDDIDVTIGDVRIKTVRAFHDDQQGAQRGRNALFVFETAGMRLVHLGDLGHPLTDEHTSAIGGPVDVLMVPVGGAFTIDSEGATGIVQALQPKLIFPMHYRTARAGTALAPVDPFLENKTVQRTGTTTTRVAADTLPDDATVMVLDYE